MIPKVIHYIWLGKNPLPKIAEKCIDSWKKFCPDYEIKRWDETNLDIEFCQYCLQAYEAKKYAFAADALRFDILYKEGGIYLDIDVELYKSLDEFLDNKVVMAFETETSVAPGLVLASERGNSCIKEILDIYLEDKFIKEDGSLNLETVCDKTTNYLVGHGLKLNNTNQEVCGVNVYATEYFCPKSLSDGKVRKTKNTVAVHHYFGSWKSKSSKFKGKVLQFIKRLVGPKLVAKLKEKRNIKNESSTSSCKQ